MYQMQRDDTVLLDIASAARQIIAFRGAMTKEDFLKDEKTQSAILHQLMVMGEATKRLSPDVRDQHVDVPWSLMAGMRDVLIHAYDIVDLDEVWKTATVDIINVLEKIEPLLPGSSE
jgi:uncharacterized protein with HEPN domain